MQDKSDRPCPGQVITACAVMHNICIGAGDIMAPDADIVRMRGRMCWRRSVVPLGGTNCVQRCLPWRRFPWTTNIYKQMPCKPTQWTIRWTVERSSSGDLPRGCPTIRGHQGPNCGSPSRSSSTTWDSLLSLS
ncbi:hypothetical protein F7725_017555 [Dissostichus mawsoni]|uniref:Uncharacterized protein n=1 Tax=Dissostichus mawsoni TaxID=36200 RepID=A0A7J5Z4S4_DISMA|nr:hypothetical protein F7725_017555 [Dissostichus mawsoni]